jgi:hypothetical protein
MQKTIELAAKEVIDKNGCAKRRLGDLHSVKLFTVKGLTAEWYALCGGAFDCVCLTQKTSTKKLGECESCRESEYRVQEGIYSLALLGDLVYGSLADMHMNHTNALFWTRTILSFEDTE